MIMESTDLDTVKEHPHLGFGSNPAWTHKARNAALLFAFLLGSCGAVGDYICDRSTELTEGIEKGAEALGPVPIVGDVTPLVAWVINFGIETLCKGTSVVLKSPETLLEEGKELVGLGSSAEPSSSEPPPPQ